MKMEEKKHFKISKKLISVFISLLFISINLHSQPTYLQFDNISNGLSTNLVTGIFQDSKGWVWFTSVQGLNKFDGIRVRTYSLSKEDSSNFKGSLARCIFEDRKGILWVGTENGGLYKFDREFETFRPFQERDKSNKKLGFSVYSIAEDKSGELWIGSNEGLKKLNKATGKFTTFTSGKFDPKLPFSNFVVKIQIDRNGKIWVGTLNGLDTFDPATKSFQHISLSSTSDLRPFISYILEDLEGKIWVGTLANGLYVINPYTNQPKQIRVPTDSEFSNSIRAILQTRNGDFWIGTGAGLYIYSLKNNRYTHHSHNQNDPLSLCHNSILSIFQDKQENVWLGTHSGISYTVPEKQAFHFYNAFSNIEDLNNHGVNAFCTEGKNIWIGMDYGGINILDSNKKTIKSLSTEKQKFNSLTTNSIRSLVTDAQGNIWICSNGIGLDVCNPKTGDIKRIKHDPLNPNSLANDWIGAIYKDSKGNLWIATASGIDKYDYTTNTFAHFSKTITDKLITWISEDSDGNIWLGGYYDIYIYNPKTNSTKKIHVNRHIIAFKEDSKHRIWLATTSKGLALFDRKTLTITKYFDESKGITNNNITSLIEDDEQTLWIGTLNGLSRFFPDQEKFRNYYKEDGTRITTYNYAACYKLPSGELLFGGYNGYVIFNPKEVKDNDYLPPVEFTDFKIFNQSVPIGAKGSPLTKHISETKNIVLSHNQNFISFRYIALNYNSPYKNKYAYILEGVDKDWNLVNERRDANYTNLEPGEYKFKVKASNNDNQWNETGKTINIIIVPPFYKTWFFRVSVIVLIISLTFILVRKRLQYIKNKNKILEQLVNEKTRDLQQLAIELEESQSEVMAQNEEIEKQNESLVELNEKIFKQNEELKHYANNLESKVIERTQELEIAKNKAEESDKLKSAILTNMSHEIRTPMNSIVGLSNLLMQDEFGVEEKKFFSTNIKKNCDILLHLINDILDLSIIEAGKLPLQFAEFNLNNLLKDIYEIFNTDKQWLEKSHLDFTLNIPSEKLLIKSDKVRVEQIVRNLLHNAFKFTEEGQIELGFKITLLDVIIYVKDSGVGIPQDKTETIFERFVKLQDSSVKYDFGVGLGLAICSKLTSMLEGKIWVESKLNEGSTFFISLPINKANDL